MEAFFKSPLSLVFIIPVIFITLSFTNMKTKGQYPYLNNADLINYAATFIYTNDITDLFNQLETTRDTTLLIVVHCDDVQNGRMDHVPMMEMYKYHKSIGLKSIAYHYYITQTGKLYQMHPEDQATNHASGYNDISVSVCLQGDFDIEKIEQKQYNSLIKTLIMLQNKYSSAKIIGHCDISKKTCPGTNIDVPEIKKVVQGFHILKL